MRREFTASTSVRNLAIFSIVFFGSALVLGLAVMPRESRPYSAAFWGCWMLSAIYELLYYKRFRMVVDGSRLAIEKPFRSYEMDLSQVNHARWQHVPTLLRLKEGRKGLRLDFGQFRLDDRLPLIELFRAAIPRNAQQGWDVFCHRVALPLRQADAEDEQDRPLEADEVLMTRRRFDRLFLCILPVVAVVAGIAAWYSHSWFLLYWSLFSVGMIWAPLRFMCSKKGYRTARITRRRDRSYFGFLFGALVVGLAGIWLCFAFNAPPAITWGGAGLWFLAVLWRAGLEGQRQAVEIEQAARGADAEWNRLLEAGTAELPQ